MKMEENNGKPHREEVCPGKKDKLDLHTETIKLVSGKLADIKIAHLTGTATFKASDAERAELKKFVEDGGTLVVDAAGGSTEFSHSVDGDLETIVGKSASELAAPLPPDHPAFAGHGTWPNGVRDHWAFCRRRQTIARGFGPNRARACVRVP